MYSRFLTWQPDNYISSQIESGEINTFVTDDDIIDIRFTLKGYGWKLSGESNRVILHYGTYKCYYKKVGDPDYTMFAFIICERENSDDPDVYKDINVTTGKIDQGKYEIKIEAERLDELTAWGGGVVEGVALGDRFYSDIYTRKLRPLNIQIVEYIDIEDPFIQPGLDPIFLVVNEYTIAITDTLTDVFIGYLIGGDSYPIFEIISIQELTSFTYIYEGLNKYETISVTEYIDFFTDIIYLSYPTRNEPIAVIEDVFLQIFPFYAYFYESISIIEYAILGIDEFGLNIYDDIPVADLIYRIKFEGGLFVADNDNNFIYDVLVESEGINIGNPITNESPLRLNMMLFQSELVEEWNDLSAWTKVELGGGTVVVSGNKVIFDKGFFGSAKAYRTFSPLNDYSLRYSFIEFTVKVDSIGSTGFGRISVNLGERMKVIFNSTSIQFEGLYTNQGFSVDFTAEKKVRLESVLTNDTSATHFRENIDIFIDGVYIGRTFSDKPTIHLDEIYFELGNVPPTTFNTHAEIGKMTIGLLNVHNPNDLLIARIDAVTYSGDFITRDITVTDIITNIGLVAHVGIVAIQLVSILEDTTINLTPLLPSVIFDNILVEDYLEEMNINLTRQVYDLITITDILTSIFVLGFEDLIIFDTLTATDVIDDITTILNIFIENCSTFDNVIEYSNGNGAFSIDPAGQMRFRVTTGASGSNSGFIKNFSASEMPDGTIRTILEMRMSFDILGAFNLSPKNFFQIEISAGTEDSTSIGDVRISSNEYRIGVLGQQRTFTENLISDTSFHNIKVIHEIGDNRKFTTTYLYVDDVFIGANGGATFSIFPGALPRLNMNLEGGITAQEVHIDSILFYSTSDYSNEINIFVADGDTNDNTRITITESRTLTVV